jgi:4-aminobutyrate aminotransferase/(S)-3-amino-2-methylpropionate transaminase
MYAAARAAPISGKRNQESLERLHSEENTEEVIDLSQSVGNYIIDVEGNTILDMNASATGSVLGYNPDDYFFWSLNSLSKLAPKRANPNALPAEDADDLIRENVLPSAPLGQTFVHFAEGSTATDANELAASVAMKHYAKAHGIEDMGKVSVVGFNNSHHGDSTTTLSFSSDDANPEGKTAFPWPRAEFPKMRYPFAYNQKANAAEEDRCVQGLADLVKSQRSAGTHVAAVFIEPMSSFGQEMATPTFYKKVIAFAKSEGIALVVDETKTGMGSSGKNWAHEHWYLFEGQEPDFVTFGGKAGVAGFFSNKSHKLDDADTAAMLKHVKADKLTAYGNTWETIANENLLHKLGDTSSFLKIELERVGKEMGDVHTVRGYGTHLAFDCSDGYLLQRWLWRNGINVGRCGPNTISLRPALILGPHDAAHLRNTMLKYHPNFVINYD